jgi:hypothetical protein
MFPEKSTRLINNNQLSKALGYNPRMMYLKDYIIDMFEKNYVIS